MQAVQNTAINLLLYEKRENFLASSATTSFKNTMLHASGTTRKVVLISVAVYCFAYPEMQFT